MKNRMFSAAGMALATISLSLAGFCAEEKEEFPEAKNPQAEGFERPFRLKAGDKLLDLAGGNAAPCLIDVYGEGKRAFLVGVYGDAKYCGKASRAPLDGRAWLEGRVRVYRNLGTEKEPRYGAFEYLNAGGKPAAVPTLDSHCFVPSFADLDGDGVLDIIAGSYPGDIFFFKGLENGKFASPITLCDSKGKMITPAKSFINVAAVDLDDDEALDLLFTSDADDKGMWWVRNVGTRNSPMFLNEELPLETINGERIGDCDKVDFIDGGVCRPVKSFPRLVQYVDWNCDGERDLISGDVYGAVIWYRNVGRDENNAPTFERGKVLIPSLLRGEEEAIIPPAEGTVPRWHGSKINVFVTDYNGDGLPDILLGDHIDQSTMSENERAEATELLKKIEVGFTKISQGEAPVDELEELEKVRASLHKITEDKTVEHSWVWVYLQKPAALQLPLRSPPANVGEGENQ